MLQTRTLSPRRVTHEEQQLFRLFPQLRKHTMTSSNPHSSTPTIQAEASTSANTPAALNDHQLEQVSAGGGMQPPARPPAYPVDGRVVMPPGQPYLGDLEGLITVDK
jgi:hypothetical protein